MKHFITEFHHGGENRSSKIKYDFSVNINPLGLPEGVRNILRKDTSVFTDYPDSECKLLREAISAALGVKIEQVVCGSGASDIIYRLCDVMNFRRVLIPVPTFSEYERALKMNGCKVEFLQTRQEDGFIITHELFNEWTQHAECVDAVFLCNPGNPSGRLIDKETLSAVADWCASNGASLIIDECFIEFSPKADELSLMNMIDEDVEIIVIRAFTKIYAMAGMRLGYTVCSRAETAKCIAAASAPWNVSGPAQAAGIEALKDTAYISETRKIIAEQRQYITEKLSAADNKLHVIDSDVNYILFSGPAGLKEAMAEEGFAVRDCSDYRGLPSCYYRVAVRMKHENEAMVEAVRRCLLWL
jgi:threonine-phosphate decarboxylase